MALQKLDTNAIFDKIYDTPDGPQRTAAYRQAIQLADEAKDFSAAMRFRASMAFFTPFYDDSPIILPVCAEFFALVEEYPELSDAEDCFYTALKAAALTLSLPQLELSVCYKMLARVEEAAHIVSQGAVRRFHMLCHEFYTYIDPILAKEHYTAFCKEPRGQYSDCTACEQNAKVWYNMKSGNFRLSREMATPIFSGKKVCHDVPWQTYALFLEHYLDQKEFDSELSTEVKLLENKLLKGGCRDKSDLANLGTVLRSMAYTNPRKGFKLLPHALQLSNGMWNQYGLYYFYKGAWCCCKAADGLGLSLMPPQGHPLQQNKQLDAATLAEWFYTQAVQIAERFDQRNGTDYYKKDLARA